VGLLSPWFLAGLAAVGLPLWLHLLRQFKRTPQPFSSLLFFERRIQSSTRHRRLRYLALLAARLAFLILLALAFANPFVTRTAATARRRALTVIAVDRSFSMHTGNRMQQAKDEAHRLVNALPARSLAQIAAVDSHVENLTPPDGDRSALNAAVDVIQPDDQASSYGEFSRALRVMDQTTGMHLEVQFITDLQQTSMPAAFGDLQAGPNTTMHVHAVGKSEANWAVESVTAPARVYDPTRVRVTATISGWQAHGSVPRKVALELEGHVVASKDVIVPDCSRAQVEFSGFEIPYGLHRCRIRIEPHDSLPNDDSFAFSMERSDARRVLFLYAHGRSRDALYYKAALESSTATGLTVEASPFESAGDRELARYAFIVLDNPGNLPSSAEHAISEYVNSGGSALVAVGPETAVTGRVPAAGNRVAMTDSIQGAGAVDTQDSALAGANYFQNVQFSRTAHITGGAGDRVIARLADGSPLLLEHRSGEGRVLVFASTLDNSATDFPIHASFLPFVSQISAYLSGAEESPSSFSVDTAVALRRSRSQTTAADVIGPDGKHELSLHDASQALSYNLAHEGFYEVQRADGKRMLLAANADRRESDLTRIPAETLELWRNTGNTAAERESAPEWEKRTEPFSFWRYVLVLVLIAAVGESILGARYLRKGKQTI
jgi:Aerotolerance regulator N-terminal/von Willebrand factor type A domain